jgi:hypothetical protein
MSNTGTVLSELLFVKYVLTIYMVVFEKLHDPYGYIAPLVLRIWLCILAVKRTGRMHHHHQMLE